MLEAKRTQNGSRVDSARALVGYFVGGADSEPRALLTGAPVDTPLSAVSSAPLRPNGSKLSSHATGYSTTRAIWPVRPVGASRVSPARALNATRHENCSLRALHSVHKCGRSTASLLHRIRYLIAPEIKALATADSWRQQISDKKPDSLRASALGHIRLVRIDHNSPPVPSDGTARAATAAPLIRINSLHSTNTMALRLK